MTVSKQTSVSLWAGTTVLEDAPVLDKAETGDVVIVASGTAGRSVAWELAEARQDVVVVVDRGARSAWE